MEPKFQLLYEGFGNSHGDRTVRARNFISVSTIAHIYNTFICLYFCFLYLRDVWVIF